MLCKVYCACCNGLEVTTVTVEVSVTDGIRFFLVGLPDNAVKESQQRIESALQCYGYRIPGKRITINLAPANIRKEGSAFDAPIAVGILCASRQLDESVGERLKDFIILGELALDGKLRGIPGALPIIIHAMEQGFKACILPPDSAMEGAEIEGITVYSAQTFKDVLEILMNPEECGDRLITSQSIKQEAIIADDDSLNYDFAQVKGQMAAKRGLEIAAAGGHNIMMLGMYFPPS